ncbi:hypothetical protein ACLB2K_055104 [Fragaria x ananassa]
MADSARSSSDTIIQLHGEEFWPLSGKPFFDIILAKSHVKPSYMLGIPAKLHSILPPCSIPTVLNFAGKSWEMTCGGKHRKHKLDKESWKAFVDDNKLKAGDGCVFEVMECITTKLELRVRILRGDIPAELLEKQRGDEAEKPIVL